jgi:hypothetical protein
MPEKEPDVPVAVHLIEEVKDAGPESADQKKPVDDDWTRYCEAVNGEYRKVLGPRSGTM